MIIDFELMKDIHLLDGNEIVLWGAGNNGRAAYTKLRRMFKSITVSKEICDNDPKKWGSCVFDDAVAISPGELLKLAETRDVLIVVASDYINDILRQMDEMGVMEQALVCSWFGFMTAVHFHIRDTIFQDEFREQYLTDIYFEDASLKAGYFWSVLYSSQEFFNVSHHRLAVHILQPGKVGSTTMYHSLKESGIPCSHIHSLFFLKEGEGESWKDYQSFCLSKFDNLKKQEIKVITLIREPISRDISCFWHLLREHKLLYSGFADKDIFKFFQNFLQVAYGGVGELEAIPQYVRGHIWWGDLGLWYQENISPLLGEDILTCPFDKEKGYAILNRRNVHVLVMQLEKMNRLNHVVKEFIGIDDFKIIVKNEARDRDYYPAYQCFKRNVDLPKDYLRKCYGPDSYVHHFYSEEDQMKFLKRWVEGYEP